MPLLQLVIFILLPVVLLGCGGGGGSGGAGQSQVTENPPVVSLSTSSDSVKLGNSYTLNWSSPTAATCIGEGSWEGSKSRSGSQSVSPVSAGSYTYQLTCTNEGGSTSKEVKILVSDSGVLFKLKVIDGYIEGANVFIDFNWNLTQDEGEPSATSNGEGNYTFSSGEGQFSAIKDLSFECAQNRIQVAEVPVGAIDSTRGAVEEPFTMFYVPGGAIFQPGNDQALSEKLINISPFTGLFLDIVASKKDELGYGSIAVADGCGQQADTLADSVVAAIAIFTDELNLKYGVSLDSLYQDYIASSNADRSAKAEKIVDYLKAAKGIRDAVRDRHSSVLPEGYAPYVGLSQAASERLFSTDKIDFLELSVGLYFEGKVDVDGWYPAESLHATELKLLANGKIVEYGCPTEAVDDCVQSEPTYENILNSFKNYVSYGALKNESIISGVSISSQYREEKSNGADGLLECSSVAQLIFDEQMAVCKATGCPQRSDYQLQINHNIGFSYPSQCDQIDDSYLYALIDQKHQWSGQNLDRNSREIYSIQYSLKANSSIYGDPPVEFLGSKLQASDYIAAYEAIGNLFIKMENLDSSTPLLVSQLVVDEFVVLARTTFDSAGEEKERYEYLVTAKSTQCKKQSWSSSAEWSVDTLTEGADAYPACLAFIDGFEF